ncbi:hypothetical protein Tco_0336484, partial [Tanacetum coccineum]
MRTRSQARKRQQQQVRQTSVESSNLEKPDNPPIVTMADNRTMAQLLEAPTEGYEDAIVIPEITANNFEIKHGLLNLVQNKQFFGNDKEDPHAHIRYFNKITSTMKFPNVPNTSVKLMLFPFSLEGAARIWLEKEPPRSIETWDDLADGESEPAEQRSVSLSHDTLAPLSEFPLAPVVAPPGIHRLRPIPARRLAWRHVSHHSSDRHSSPDSSSSSAPSDHSLSGHTPPDTTDADSSTPQRFRSAPLSTPYPPTTSESSLVSSSERSLDSSSHSSRPSRKRCRSPTASVPSSTHVSRSIAPTPADLLPPRKRFRDSYSLEDSREEHMEVDTTDAEAVADVGISEGVVAYPEDGIGIGFEIAASDVREDDEEFEVEASAADTREI